MDNIDSKILKMLQENARIQNAEMARELGMAPSGVLERVRKLEKKGIIREYVTHLNPEMLDLKLLAFIQIRSVDTPGSQSTADQLNEIPEILEIHNVAGDDCYLIKIRSRDSQTLSNFIRQKLGAIENITSTKTLIVLDTLKERSQLTLNNINRDE